MNDTRPACCGAHDLLITNLLGLGHGLLVPPSLSGTVGLIPALAGSAAAVAGLVQ